MSIFAKSTLAIVMLSAGLGIASAQTSETRQIQVLPAQPAAVAKTEVATETKVEETKVEETKVEEKVVAPVVTPAPEKKVVVEAPVKKVIVEEPVKKIIIIKKPAYHGYHYNGYGYNSYGHSYNYAPSYNYGHSYGGYGYRSYGGYGGY